MIRQIVIHSIAIADNLSVDFENGLNIVTGETGAGKSILVDALALLRGGRVDTSLIRSGCETAQVSAVFTVKADSFLFSFLAAHGIERDAECPNDVMLRRVVQKNGRHRAFVNDVPVNSRTLQSAAEHLIDISSQFENQRLLDPQTHTSYLDVFAGVSATSLRVASTFDEVQAALTKIRELEKERERRRREKDLFEFELAEIDEAAPDAAEFMEVEELLRIGKKTSNVDVLCRETLDLLVESDTSVHARLRLARRNFAKLERLSEGTRAAIAASDADEAIAALEVMASRIDRFSRSFSVDEKKLAWAEQRVEIYNKLLRKYGQNIDAVIKHRQECAEFLNGAGDVDSHIQELTEKALLLVRDLIITAQDLSTRRIAVPEKLSAKVEKELAELGMVKARFKCSFAERVPRSEDSLPAGISEELTADERGYFLRVSRQGFEEVRFLLSANAGMEPQAIEKVASGGELSRVMLAIKTVLFSDESVNLFVFDEIDTGISGGIASKVGRKLAQFCAGRQVICITHLPQVACYAENHFLATKSVNSGKTVAHLSKLGANERAHELAVMLSGEKVSAEGVAQAHALLAEARAEVRVTSRVPR
jgi:DNA repair protein RecN (Recombination protein N)